MDISVFSKTVLREIYREKPKSKKEVQKIKFRIAEKLGVSRMPSNPTILSFAKKRDSQLLFLLGKKPVKTLSGIAVVSVMTAPHPCPGKCIYCPSSLVEKPTPKAYTGREPTTMRAIRNNYNAKKQVQERIRQLEVTGHSVQKIELIVMGGTFLSQGVKYQEFFVKNMLDGVTGNNSSEWREAVRKAETSEKRVTGITFETRPDYCSEKDIKRMLWFGGTRVELGSQVLDDKINFLTRRGHTVQDLVVATQKLKDSGFKVCHHLMPGLPFSDRKTDFDSAIKTFTGSRFKPDMVKFYPCLVIENTPLFEMYERKEFSPITNEEAATLLAEIKSFTPKWLRINRIQRDIPAPLISAGVKRSDLRELIKIEMQKKGWKCKCIRCREAGLKAYKLCLKTSLDSAELFVEKYSASGGIEYFISFEDSKQGLLYGFCRLRIPGNPFMKELKGNTAIIRELRVFGKALGLHEQSMESNQHKGLGKKLFVEAEKIAVEKESCNKLAVISGLGVKEYYIKKFGCKKDGPFVSKRLR